MTTFVLHGGGTSAKSADNDLFFRQFSELVEKDEVRVLMCLWSRPKEKWESLLERVFRKILEQADKKVSFDVLETVEEIEEKISASDVLYVKGGKATLLEPYYPQLKDLKKLIKGKVFVGDSMGAFMVSTNYVLSFPTQEDSSVHQGLGILPIQTLCHWDVEENKKRKLKLLKDSNSDLPIVSLDEGKFTRIYL